MVLTFDTDNGPRNPGIAYVKDSWTDEDLFFRTFPSDADDVRRLRAEGPSEETDNSIISGKLPTLSE